MKLRTMVVALVMLLLLPLGVGGVFLLGVAAQLPSNHQARVEGPHGMFGVQAAGSYAWVVPVGSGKVVLVDTGQDARATALLAEIGGREVEGILLTHAHSDTIAGLDAFPDTPVYVAAAELPLLHGEVEPKGWMAAWLDGAVPRPRLPEVIEPVSDGEVVELGEARFRAIHVPGHTAGSVVWAWRDVLFVGDALLVAPRMTTMMAAFSDDADQARDSLTGLLDVAFDTLADARGGLKSDGRSALASYLGEPLAEATIQVFDRAPAVTRAGSVPGPVVVLQGVVRRDPREEGADAELVTEDGQIYRLEPLAADADASTPTWEALLNQSVTVRGRPTREPLGRAVDARPLLAVDDLQVDEGQDAVQGPVAVLDVEDCRRGQWVRWTGWLEAVEPLSAHATWGRVDVGGVQGAAPLAWVSDRLGQEVTLLATVSRVAGGPHLTVHAVCDGEVPSCGREPEPVAVPDTLEPADVTVRD